MRGGWACPSIASTARLGHAATREGAATTRKHNAETRREFSKVYHAAMKPSIQKTPQAWLVIGGCHRPKQGHGAPQHRHKHSLHPARPPSPASVMPHFPKARNQLQLLMRTPLLHMASSGAVRTLPTLSFSLWSFLAGGAASGEDEASVSCLDNFALETDIIQPPKMKTASFFSVFSMTKNVRCTLEVRTRRQHGRLFPD